MPDSPSSTTLAHRKPVPGRLAMMTSMALLANLIPLPFVPDRVLKQLRGTVAHETLSRHGVSMASDAREQLSRTGSKDPMRSMLRKSLEFLARRVLRRAGPLAPLGTVISAFEVYALGHLLDRYASDVRPRGTLRMQREEAERVRKAIDRAILQAFAPATTPTPLRLAEGSEDLRDEFTRWLDMLLIGSATLPSYIARRLDAAFDDVVESTPGLRGA